MNDLPHPVPSIKGQQVLIRDGHHKGTKVTNLGTEFLFESLDGLGSHRAERCVLVKLSPPEFSEETGQEIFTWDQALPYNAPHGVDLDGPGYALIGLSRNETLDPRIGSILWGLHSGLVFFYTNMIGSFRV